MPRRKRTKKSEENSRKLTRLASGIALIAFGLILALSAFGLAGLAGQALFATSFGFIGIGSFLLPILLVMLGLTLMLERDFMEPLTGVGLALIVASVILLFGMGSAELGGTLGHGAASGIAELFGFWGALILFIATALIGLAILTDLSELIAALSGSVAAMKNVRLPKLPAKEAGADKETEDDEEDEEGAVEEEEEDEEEEREPVVTMFNEVQEAGQKQADIIPTYDAEYHAPPLSLLGQDKGKPGVGDIKANANIIKRTFQNFGISVEMDEVSVGPTVTRYAIKPAEGVRLQRIVALQQNLELALAAHPVRLEAPIPGKSLVGIEVPNAAKAMVGLGGVLGAPEWGVSKKPLLAAIGRDIAGTPHYVNAAKMPHLLVAGATGSGKSVAIHALITSLLYRNGPNQLRFIMVDPKRVELTLYNGIPHLLTPVITDPKKCIMALKWAAKEMERRYTILETKQVRDIDSYHSSIFEPAKKKGDSDNLPEAMPYIVIVLDELADIMQSFPRELEACIVRLAQMSRAVGIHLILSTQRPSVNVITGLIKANVPTRMALQVASQIDSRTILDGPGAESLLGAGDMLYLSSDMQKPVRLQTAYIAEDEVKKVVSYIKQHNAGSLGALDLGGGADGSGHHEPNDAILMGSEDDDVDDDLYSAAKEAVEEAGRASTSYLQRKLRIGYSRAARLMDLLEEKGIIGPADGSRPREVLGQGGTTAEESEETY